MNEKAGAEVLEDATRIISNTTTCFTVVSNVFAALECTEHTYYKTIIVKANLNHLNAFEMLRVLRNVECEVPIVLLLDADDSTTMEEAHNLDFCGILRKPYTSAELCNVIIHSLNRGQDYESDESSELDKKTGNSSSSSNINNIFSPTSVC